MHFGRVNILAGLRVYRMHTLIGVLVNRVKLFEYSSVSFQFSCRYIRNLSTAVGKGLKRGHGDVP